MRRLRNSNADESFSSEMRIISQSFTDDSLKDYVNDSGEEFFAKYQHAVVVN